MALESRDRATSRTASREAGALKVLVIGKGGREHALCWKLKQSPRVTAVFCAPGNAGTALDVQNVPIEPGDIRGLIQFAKREGIGLTVVGPEEPLANGIVDAFQREGLRIFGPRKDAAELEGSKVFAKELMRQAGHPHGRLPDLPLGPRRRALHPLARGLAGRPLARAARRSGTPCICRTAAETLEAIDRIMDPREMLGPGVQVEIEERGQRRVFSTGGRGARLRPGPARSAWSSRPTAWPRARGSTSATTSARRSTPSTRSWSGGSTARPATG